jgi:hypothetical protein
MDQDSKTNALIRSATLLLAGLIVVGAFILVGFNRLDSKDLIALVGQALGVAGAGRMMTFPTATTTTKQTDPTTGKVIAETKTQQPLGMPTPVPAPVAAPPAVSPPPPIP